jgi:hypothetical protein
MKTTILFLFLPFLIFSQTSSQIIDFKTNEPIPFVNVWIKGSQSGTTSNDNGKFELALKAQDTLVLSAVGFEGREIPFKSVSDILIMNRSVEKLEAVNIEQPYFSKERRFGKIKPGTYNSAFSCGTTPWMVGSNIPYDTVFTQTPFLKKIVISTYSNIKNARFAIRLYAGNDSLFKRALNDSPIITIAKRGQRKTEINLSSLNFKFPKEGLKVVLEFLIIEENKHLYRAKSKKTGKTRTYTSYEPRFWVRKKKDLKSSHIAYRNGKWRKRESAFHEKPNSELAIQLVMSD